MANINVKSEDRKRQEAYVMKSFGVVGGGTAQQREAAECIAARSREAMSMAQKMGGRR